MTIEVSTEKMIKIKTLVLGEGIQHTEVPEGSSVEDWIRVKGLPDIMMANGVSCKINGGDKPLTTLLRNNDTVVISPKKTEGGY